MTKQSIFFTKISQCKDLSNKNIAKQRLSFTKIWQIKDLSLEKYGKA